MSNIDFSKGDQKEFEISAKTLKPILIYIEKTYSHDILIQFIKETGSTIDFLENGKNWVSWEYHNHFLEKLIEFTKDEDAPFKAGKYLLSKESYGPIYAVLSVLKIFGTPNLVYQRIADASSSFTNCGRFEVLDSGKNKIIYKNIYYHPHKANKANCKSVMGQFASIPCFWNLPPAKVKEIQCAADGADSCIYEFSWHKKPVRTLIFPILASITLLTELILLLFTKHSILEFKDFLLTGAGIAMLSADFKIFEYKKLLHENEKLHTERSKELELAVYNEKLEYQKIRQANKQIKEKAEQLSLLNYISEEIIKIENEEHLLTFIMDILIKSFSFKRSFYISSDDELKNIKGPVIFIENDDKCKIVQHNDKLNSKFLKGEIKNNNFRLIRNSFFISESEWNTIFVIPISIREKYHCILGFELKTDQVQINDMQLQFFQTVSKQIEIALNNIYYRSAAHSILKSIPSSVLVFDIETLKISYINSSCEEFMNRSNKKLINKNVTAVLKIDKYSKATFINQIEEVKKENQLQDLELLLDNKTIGYTLFKLPDAGTKKEIGMIMKNITKQKEIRDQLIRAEKMAALGTLTSGVAHEVNNPLYGVLGIAEMIQDISKSAEVKELITEIIDYTIQASDIVKDLSSYSRSIRQEEAGKINLEETINNALRMIKYGPQYIDVTVKKNFLPVPNLFGLEGEIRQIYINLFNNAIQAMDGKGDLIIDLQIKGKYIQTTIKDTGLGIEEDHLHKIFDPFFTTKNPGKGTGLGLNIVYRLVTKYNGLITAKSKKGKGTTFIINFPFEDPNESNSNN